MSDEKYNPVKFRQDFTALSEQNPAKAREMAGNWRLRLEGALEAAEAAAQGDLTKFKHEVPVRVSKWRATWLWVRNKVAWMFRRGRH